jgi:dihydrolipoamide dehydrogenase
VITVARKAVAQLGEIWADLDSGLLKKAGVKVVEGWARFRDSKTVKAAKTEIGLLVIRAEQVVIATGSDAIELPFLPFGDR